MTTPAKTRHDKQQDAANGLPVLFNTFHLALALRTSCGTVNTLILDKHIKPDAITESGFFLFKAERVNELQTQVAKALNRNRHKLTPAYIAENA